MEHKIEGSKAAFNIFTSDKVYHPLDSFESGSSAIVDSSETCQDISIVPLVSKGMQQGRKHRWEVRFGSGNGPYLVRC
jgi:hypothetical protein